MMSVLGIVFCVGAGLALWCGLIILAMLLVDSAKKRDE